MLIKKWKKEILTIPNILSLLRLLLIPVYVTIYLQAQTASEYLLAGTILALSCLTDLLDGKIARHFNMISTLGKILDPLADKATQLSLILCLATKHAILWYLVALFLIKETFQLVAGAIYLRRGIMLRSALTTGKLSTTVLFVSLTILVALPEVSSQFVGVITVIDAAFMIAAFIDYATAYRSRDDAFEELDRHTE